MQNEIKKKVNVFGKIGKIIATVLLVIVLIVGVAAAAGGVYLSTLPDDAISIAVSGKAKIHLDESLFGTLVGSIIDELSFESSQMPDYLMKPGLEVSYLRIPRLKSDSLLTARIIHQRWFALRAP